MFILSSIIRNWDKVKVKIGKFWAFVLKTILILFVIALAACWIRLFIYIGWRR